MKLTFKESFPVAGNIRTFVFEPESPVSWQPGQLLHYILPHDNVDDRGTERWFTISSAPFEQDIWITTRIQESNGSSFKQALLALENGQTIEAEEPEGNFVVENPANNHVFVAGGIGITPFRSIIKQLRHDGQAINVELLYANRDEQDVAFREELEAIANEHENFTITYFFGDNLIDEAALKTAGSKLKEPIYYLSGPKPMVKNFETLLVNAGIDEEHIKLDGFPGYDT